MSHLRRSALVAVATLAALAPGAQAATWTEVPSNTTEDITAIEYQGPDRLWFTTGAGKIFKRVGGVFQLKASNPATVFRDIEFQDGGQVGFAVGTNGVIMRSADGGDTWAAVPGITGGRQTDEGRCDLADQPIGDVDAVRFAGSSRVWLAAGGTQVYRTVTGATAANVGSTAAGFQYTNDDGDNCRLSGSSTDIDDLFPVPGSDAVYFISKNFGDVFFSSNALSSAATRKPGSAGNGFQATRRAAGDPANPNRQWAVTPDGDGGSYYSRTTDGWNTDDDWAIGTPDRDSGDLTRGEAVDYNGGTVTAVGSAGMIVTSIDGTTFFFDPAGGTVATQNWRSVSLASAADAAVGGTGGKLILSSNANVIPDVVAPTGTIGGPGTTTVGQPTTFTAQVADNAGGVGVDPAGYGWSVSGLPGQSGPSAVFRFPSSGNYTVRLTFRDLAGNAREATRSVRVNEATPPKPPLPPASVTPVISGLRFSPPRFRPAKRGAGTTSQLRYTLNVAATVRFIVQRKVKGRRVGGRCVKSRRSNRKRPSCSRYVRVSGGFVRTRAAGLDSFRFAGRIAGRTLGPGLYRLRATPAANGRTGVTRTANFRVLKKPRRR
ncbi:MAG: hypothetical protein AVDCRST_MAG53-1278 [uncultured Solirubrobacteraceae bacterium]|uniref:PKD domain-containing protein n=1 Tax=uncultured Solirubrobacteraceae bacterium TaxID=1162706 RepID=A0A6J4RDC5_9ACTN|nr:MAG: hypothetical protein AVDCRST_MAG53-1278 [uncultured Solirubrobacteraceae bacterium]